jgi:hypothetical protein
MSQITTVAGAQLPEDSRYLRIAVIVDRPNLWRYAGQEDI